MLDELERGQQYRLIGGVLLLAVISFGAGTAVGGASGGSIVGEAVSSDTATQNVQSFLDQQMQQQRQQFSLIASQRPNISEDDLSLEATVTSVSKSDFGSLREVTVSITGTVPAQTGGTRQVEQEQVFYISQDGRYLFQQPRDLEQVGQQPTAGGQTQGTQ